MASHGVSFDASSLSQAEQRADITELTVLLAQATDMVRWGSWTVAADLADKAAAKARDIREREVQSRVRQEEIDFGTRAQAPTLFPVSG